MIWCVFGPDDELLSVHDTIAEALDAKRLEDVVSGESGEDRSSPKVASGSEVHSLRLPPREETDEQARDRAFRRRSESISLEPGELRSVSWASPWKIVGRVHCARCGRILYDRRCDHCGLALWEPLPFRLGHGESKRMNAAFWADDEEKWELAYVDRKEYLGLL